MIHYTFVCLGIISHDGNYLLTSYSCNGLVMSYLCEAFAFY